MEDILNSMKGELRGALVATEYDRIETTLAGSGMIEAAAEAARKLEKSFQ